MKTATLVGYIDEMISQKMVPSWENALGLYVVGRIDPEIRHLENAIIAEKRTDRLRIISSEFLLSLAEMMSEFDVSHEDILAVIRPSGPKIDPIVDLMARLVAGRIKEPVVTPQEPVIPEPIIGEGTQITEPPDYWLTPVKSDEVETAEECIKNLVGHERIYAFGERTPGRRRLKPGDWICFYATGKGVVAHAQVTSAPKKELHPKVRHSERYPWVFHLDDVSLYLDEPNVIDATVRDTLDAFQGKDPNKNWAWFVQATNKVTKHDFDILTGR